MNITLAQLNPIPSNIEYNKNKILAVLGDISEKSELIIFPELFLYGSSNFNMIKQYPFILSQIESVLDEIKKKTKTNVLLSVPQKEDDNIKTKYVLISPNASKEGKTFELKGKTFEVITKKDFENKSFKSQSQYLIGMFSLFSRTNSEYFIHQAAKNFACAQNKKFILINQTGANDELVYGGLSKVYNEKGELIALLKAFEEDIHSFNLEDKKVLEIPEKYLKTTNLDSFSLDYENDLERTYEAIVLSIKDYFSKNGFKQAVLGLSGGLDSTVCAVLLADALGKENVLGVSMPSKISSNGSKTDAYELAKNLGINYITSEIKDYHKTFSDGFEKMFEDISALWNNRYIKSYTQDNIQARSRAMILWGIANEYASTLPIATSDKSETYMGYATINGDMSGGFAPIADVTKTKLFALANWLNKNRQIKNAIPESVILKPPGAELAINPKTGKTLTAEDALMPYEFLDEVIWRIENLHQSIDNMMQNQFLYEKKNIINENTKKQWLEKFFKRMNAAAYKWYIAAPSPIVDSHSLKKAEFPIVSNINYSK